MHLDIDSFILYKAEQTQKTILHSVHIEPKEIAVSTQKENNQSLELSNQQDGQNTTNNEQFFPPDSGNYEHEILWHLEFDGLVNKLGVGEGVWI